MELILNLLQVIGLIFFFLFVASSFRQEGQQKTESMLNAIISILLAVAAGVIGGI